ncbi:MAG: MFS transporter [Calditrichaeota bacterium]|nr:MFS transporter [Calditrichota bacterium]MCB9369084.1 MFS transporter [Calditrichota bacterium]
MTRRLRIEPLLIFLTMLPVTGVVPILKTFVMDGFGVSEFWTHVFLAANMLAAFLFAPIAGSLADKFGMPRAFISIAALLDGLCFVIMPHVPDFTSLMTLRFIEGVFHIGTLSLLLAVAGGRSGKHGSSMGVVGAAITFGVALGSPIGGWLGSHSPMYSLTLGGILLFVVAIGTLFLDVPHEGLAQRQPIGKILKLLTGEPKLRLPYVFAFLDRFTVGFFVASFPILAATKFEFSPGQIGGHIAAFMLTMGLLCPFVVKLSKKFSQTQLLLWGSLTYGVFFASVGFVEPPLLIVWMFLLGAASAVMFIPTLQLSAGSAPSGNMATAMGGFTSAGAFGFLMGPIISGALLAVLARTYEITVSYGFVLFFGGFLEVVVAGFLLIRGLVTVRSTAR